MSERDQRIGPGDRTMNGPIKDPSDRGMNGPIKGPGDIGMN